MSRVLALVLVLGLAVAGTRGWGLGGGVAKVIPKPVKSIGGAMVDKVKNETAKGIETVKEVGQAVLPSPSDVLDGIKVTR